MKLSKSEIAALDDMSTFSVYIWKRKTMVKLEAKGLVEVAHSISGGSVPLHGWKLTDAGRATLTQGQ